MPLDRGIIDQQLQALGEGQRWWDQREMRDLPAALHGDEQILALGRGKLSRIRWIRRSWLFVVTDRRLLGLRSAHFAGWRQFEIPAAQITRLTLRIGPFRGRILIGAAGHTYRLLLPRTDAYRLMNALASVGAAGQAALSGMGPTRVVRRVVDHVLSLPAVALNPHPALPMVPPPPAVDTAVVDQRFQSLEDEVQELRRQIDFLQELLRDRQASGS